MLKFKNFLKRLKNDESGQGMAEYVLLIVVVLTVAFMFKDKIRGMVETKLGEVEGSMGNFRVEE